MGLDEGAPCAGADPEPREPAPRNARGAPKEACAGAVDGLPATDGGQKQSRPAEMNDALQMKGLREQVGERNGLDLIAGGDQSAEIAGEGGWVAGDVDERRGCDGCQQRGDFGAEARARGIENNEVGDRLVGPAQVAVGTEELEGVGVDGMAGGAFEVMQEGSF